MLWRNSLSENLSMDIIKDNFMDFHIKWLPSSLICTVTNMVLDSTKPEFFLPHK